LRSRNWAFPHFAALKIHGFLSIPAPAPWLTGSLSVFGNKFRAKPLKPYFSQFNRKTFTGY
jgi:hypothetical protein